MSDINMQSDYDASPDSQEMSTSATAIMPEPRVDEVIAGHEVESRTAVKNCSKDRDSDGSEASKLVAELLQQQIDLLRQINDRQNAADLSRKPIPPVTAQSSSAWNPLLNSTLARIGPIIDRWRGSLDVLLVFIGLFSAIVTSFFVDSLHRLGPDQGARTNELLVNLTDIIIQLSGTQSSRLSIPSSTQFVPDASDVRINAYWSLALIISISAAALAVAGRAFLATLTKSTGKPHEKLADIHRRWEQAEAILGPALETLPVVLAIPLALFLLGLLENIYSAALSAHHHSNPVIIAASFSAATIFLVGAALLYASFHAYRYPESSPFRTTASQVIRASVQRLASLLPTRVFLCRTFMHLKPWIFEQEFDSEAQSGHENRHRPSCMTASGSIFRVVRAVRSFLDPIHALSRRLTTHIKSSTHTKTDVEPMWPEKPTPDELDKYLPFGDQVYHATLQATHDDDSLDQAAAAFTSICRHDATRNHILTSQPFSGFGFLLAGLELRSFIHLLSPEASYRCNLTAAECILRLHSFSRASPAFLGIHLCGAPEQLGLLVALFGAARRELSQINGTDLWHSIFIRTFATVVQWERDSKASYIINMLTSKAISASIDAVLPDKEETQAADLTIQVTFSCIFDAVQQDSGQAIRWVDCDLEMFGHSISRLLGSSDAIHSIGSRIASICLCRWDMTERQMLAGSTVNGFLRAMVRWIWPVSSPTIEDIIHIIAHIPCTITPTSLAVVHELIHMTKNRQTWQHFDTRILGALLQLPSRLSDYPISESEPPSLMGVIAHIGSRLATSPDKPSKLSSLTCTYAFSALFEMLSAQCRTLSIGEIPPDDVDTALLHILGPRHLSELSNIYAAVCLCFWNRVNIFTGRMIHGAPRECFIMALIRWLWSDDPVPIDIPEYLTAIRNLGNNYTSDVLIALLSFDHDRTHTLHQIFFVLDNPPFLVTETADFVAMCCLRIVTVYTRQNKVRFSRQQADVLVRTHAQVVLYELYNNFVGAAADVHRSFRELWIDIYGSNGVGNGEELTVPDPFPGDFSVVDASPVPDVRQVLHSEPRSIVANVLSSPQNS